MADYERRKDDATIAEMLGMMRSMAQDFRNQADKLLCVESKIDQMLSVLPKDRLPEVRNFIEHGVNEARDNHQLHQSLKRNIVEKGIWITIVIVAVALWEYIKVKVQT